MHCEPFYWFSSRFSLEHRHPILDGSRSCSAAFSVIDVVFLSFTQTGQESIRQAPTRQGNLLCGLPHIPQATSAGIEPAIFCVTDRRDNHYATKPYWDFKGDPCAWTTTPRIITRRGTVSLFPWYLYIISYFWEKSIVNHHKFLVQFPFVRRK